MKIVVGLVVALLVAVSLFADYKWRRWIATRAREREQSRE
jgi:hypothetical protein